MGYEARGILFIRCSKTLVYISYSKHSYMNICMNIINISSSDKLMPGSAEFLSGFNLIKGSKIHGYILKTVMSTHETIKRYNEYQYDITLTFENLGNGSYHNLFDYVIELISQHHVIYAIRNPYICTIDIPKLGDILEDNVGTIIFKLTGHSHRIYGK